MTPDLAKDLHLSPVHSAQTGEQPSTSKSKEGKEEIIKVKINIALKTYLNTAY